MLSKISSEDVIKGFIFDYTKIKDEFKEILHDAGFIWNKDWERRNMFGREGVWLNPVLKLSIRIRWGIVNSGAIIYVEKEFIEKIKDFLDHYFINEGIDFPNFDYDLLNNSEYLKNLKITIKASKSSKSEIIEGDVAYLEKENDNDTVKIVIIGGIERRVKINKLGDFIKKSRLDKTIKAELKLLIAEANTKGWYRENYA